MSYCLSLFLHASMLVAHAQDLAAEAEPGRRFPSHGMDENAGWEVGVPKASNGEATRETQHRGHGLIPSHLVKVTGRR